MDKNRTFPLKKVRIYDSSKNKMSYLSMGYHLIKQSMGDPVLATYSYESKTGIYPIYMLEVKEGLYERDIVEFSIDGKKSRGVIQYDVECAAYVVLTPKGNAFPLCNVTLGQVIGNAYQTPLLMNNGENNRNEKEVTSEPEKTKELKEDNKPKDTKEMYNIDLYVLVYSKGERIGSGYALSCKGKTQGEMALYEDGDNSALYYKLQELIKGFSKISAPSKVTIHDTSAKFGEAFSSLKDWKEADWKNSSGEEIKERASWEVLYEVLKKGNHRVQVVKDSAENIKEIVQKAAS